MGWSMDGLLRCGWIVVANISWASGTSLNSGALTRSPERGKNLIRDSFLLVPLGSILASRPTVCAGPRVLSPAVFQWSWIPDLTPSYRILPPGKTLKMPRRVSPDLVPRSTGNESRTFSVFVSDPSPSGLRYYLRTCGSAIVRG